MDAGNQIPINELYQNYWDLKIKTHKLGVTDWKQQKMKSHISKMYRFTECMDRT